MYGKLDANYHLANKKAFFANLMQYYTALNLDPFEVAIPLTFHIKSCSDPEFKKFEMCFNNFADKSTCQNVWIIKPGENTNRGCGIQVSANLSEIKTIIQSFAKQQGGRTSIVQKYIENPLLIAGRKFDIRAFAMLTSINGVLKAYMYKDCYFRTSSKPFELSNLNSRLVHLTNDAV